MIATTEQYAAMLDAASAGGYALPAVNVTSSETLNGAMRGFAEAGADGIVQVSTGGGRVPVGRRGQRHGARRSGPRRVRARARRSLPGADRPAHRSLPAGQVRRVRATADRRVAPAPAAGPGAAVHSHMFDGSTLPLEDNLRIAAPLLDELSRPGVVLEVECGVVGGEEDGVAGRARKSELYTTTEDLLRVADVLGTGERGRYLLAATFGNVHGVYAPGNVQAAAGDPPRRPARARRRHPARASSTSSTAAAAPSPTRSRAAIANGVVKLNVDTDAQYAFTRAVADHMLHQLRRRAEGRRRRRAQVGLRPPRLGPRGRGRARAPRYRGERAVRRRRTEPAAMTAPRTIR